MSDDLEATPADPTPEPTPPGRRLRQELDARGWTQADFAEILDRPVQFVSEVVTGKKEITRESAAQFAAALGTSAEFWLTLQDAYHLGRLSQDPAMRRTLDGVRCRAELALALNGRPGKAAVPAPDHYTLGRLIARLQQEPDPAQRVMVGFREPHSYRGYYEQLAFEVAVDVTVGEMLAVAESALGSTYEAWKGGDYLMREDTETWLVSERGCSNGETLGAVMLTLMLSAWPEPA